MLEIKYNKSNLNVNILMNISVWKYDQIVYLQFLVIRRFVFTI